MLMTQSKQVLHSSSSSSSRSRRRRMEKMKVEALSAASSPPHPLDLFFYSTPSSPRFSMFDNVDDHISLLSCRHDDSHSFPSAAAADHQPSSSEFDFSGQLDMMVPPSLSTADQLFDGGIIRPLKPPPGLNDHYSPSPSPSPRSPIVSKFRNALSISPRHADNNNDPFETALRISATKHAPPPSPVRGRDPKKLRGNSSSRKALSRSLSPLRVSEFALLQQQQQQQQQEEEEQNSKDGSSSSISSKSSRKWRLRDLFRSASEGRPGAGGGSNNSKKYSFLSRRNSMETADKDKEGSSKGGGGSSFRSTASGGGSVSNRRVSDNNYTAKRSVPELKKRTSLSYRHGLLGCLGFSPILQDISTAFASSS